MSDKQLPKQLQGVLWSASIDKLKLKKDKSYIINQVLAFGTLAELKWLFSQYPTNEIRDVFLHQPIKEYTYPAFNFAKNILLELDDLKLPLNHYVRDLPRHTR